MLVQGHHSKCGPADLLFSAFNNSQRGPCQQKLLVAVLASLHDECPEWPFVGWLWTGKQCHFVECMCMFLLISPHVPSLSCMAVLWVTGHTSNGQYQCTAN
jgi:hypothetical protein